MSGVNEAVRDRYASAARRLLEGDASACGGGACAPLVRDYREDEVAGVGLGLGVSLGCGNPTLLAALGEGERVLDLGSGGGMDVLLSARRVGPAGHAYGVDMTDEMLALAERNRARAGAANATFLRGSIDSVPLPGGSVDVVISNCVINLAEDKAAVLREAHRVLRPGGRLAVADMVQVEALAPEVRAAPEMWSACVAGALEVEEYRALLLAAGFEAVEIQVHSVDAIAGGGRIGSAYIRATKPAGAGGEATAAPLTEIPLASAAGCCGGEGCGCG